MKFAVSTHMPRSRGIAFKKLLDAFDATDRVLRRRAADAVDNSLVIRNWLWGRYIVEYEQGGRDRAHYGDRLIRGIARGLVERGLKGCSYRSLQLFKRFYVGYPEIVAASPQLIAPITDKIVQTPSAQLMKGLAAPHMHGDVLNILSTRFRLPWSHYAFLVQIENDEERRFYEIEAQREGWSMRELKRQFNVSLYERLCLSRNKDRVRALSRKGHVIEAADDAIKDPYVLEFLGLEERHSYSESDLERAIIDNLERFLLEFGKGFLFEARQKRFTFDDEHFYVDLVFYNRILRCYVLVDLKIGRLSHQDLGQMQMYVNYFDRHMKTDDENPTIGILLCRTKKDALVKLTLPMRNKTIFASRYQLYLPSKEELRKHLMSLGSAKK